MPELPEVETVIKILEPAIKGKKILSIDVLRDCTIVGDEKTFVNTLTGKTFNSVSRIGKFLIFHLSDEVVFISHLRMEGKYFEISENEPNTYYSRVVFHLSGGIKLCYDDSRCFGMMKLTDEKSYKQVKDIAQLGSEPFDVKDVSFLLERTKKSNHPIKATLLDQTLMTGLGNIYADEVLFASKINPLTPAKLITKKQWEDIVENSKRILKEAIERGGSTIRSYHPGKGVDGRFQNKLQAYGKAGTACPRCGHILRFTKVGGRGTTFCPCCQEKKGDSIKVAIFGKIASGKSTVLEAFKNKEILTLSCDEVVAELYKNKEVINKVNSTFGFPKSNEVNKEGLRAKVQDPKEKKKLESIIHPLVIKEVDKFLSSNKGVLVVEVPLLFEAKMEDMFDVILAVDIDSEIQMERLDKRNGKYAKALKNINAINNKFDENKKKADFVVVNNADLKSLNKSVNEIISKLTSRLS